MALHNAESLQCKLWQTQHIHTRIGIIVSSYLSSCLSTDAPVRQADLLKPRVPTSTLWQLQRVCTRLQWRQEAFA